MISSLAAVISVLAFAGTTSGACPALPNPLPLATSLPIIPPSQIHGNSSTEPPCRKAEIKTLAQEYLYGYYPDRSQETVTATRSGTSITIIRAGGKSASFKTTLTLPSGSSAAAPVPVMINTGGVDTNVFIGSRVALATFDVGTVAADSTTKSGAFWTLYSGRDIGVLTAWAWGYHRIIDALIQVAPEIDINRIGVTGCSRWGKAALAAGIFDERVTLLIPMSSGIEGVGPWRFFFEEGGANEKINNIFGFAPYWVNLKISGTPLARSYLERSTPVYPTSTRRRRLLGDKLGVGIRDSNHCDISGYANIQDFMKKTFFNTAITRNYSDITPYTPFTSAFPWLGSAPQAKYTQIICHWYL
ncbi:hypothetical protein BD779DRAFT_1470664 [Infundibulicybe gibba]|nr:hypothetical protein BD779DRAFT_1470664 [Infundibulicybe gibba]